MRGLLYGICCHTTTAMHKLSTLPPPPPAKQRFYLANISLLLDTRRGRMLRKKTSSNISFFSEDCRTVTSRWQGAPYSLRYGRGLAAKQVISFKKTWRGYRRTTLSVACFFGVQKGASKGCPLELADVLWLLRQKPTFQKGPPFSHRLLHQRNGVDPVHLCTHE